MPDISMCSNKECQLRGDCYRYLAIPSELGQSYGGFKYQDHDCLWPVNGRNVRKLEKIENENQP